jgi:hypothetical protein
MKIMTVVNTDENAKNLAQLISDLEAAGYACDLCPDALKPAEATEFEYIEVSREVNKEALHEALRIAFDEIQAICARHEGAFCHEIDKLPPDWVAHIGSPTWDRWMEEDQDDWEREQERKRQREAEDHASRH